MTNSTMERAKQGMKNMLIAFQKSEHHRGALMTALASFGFKTVDEVTDAQLFDVVEAARGLAGMPTGFMFANAKAEALGISTANKSNAQRIQDLARDYYATANADAAARLTE